MLPFRGSEYADGMGGVISVESISSSLPPQSSVRPSYPTAVGTALDRSEVGYWHEGTFLVSDDCK